MTFPPMNFDGMNEADIRAEVIDPLLRHLGYQSGTEFNIVRERALRYPRRSLGRKKSSDPEIKGRPDYILEKIRGLDRWIVEAKPPGSDISQDDIEQAFSYAFLPEVAAGTSCIATASASPSIRRSTDPAPLLSSIFFMSNSARNSRSSATSSPLPVSVAP